MIMRGARILFCCILLGLTLSKANSAFAQNDLSVPTYHWAQDYFWEWQIRHPVSSLFAGALPFTFSQLDSFAAQANATDNYTRFLRARLREDVQPFENKALHRPYLRLGTLADETAGHLAGTNKSRLAYRFFTNIAFSPHLQILNAVNLDQNLGDDSTYVGKRWRGFTGISEQAYALLHFDHFLVKFGRDYIRWGRAQDAALTVSDASRPFDQLQVQLRTANVQFTYFTSKLNTIFLSDTAAAQLQTPWAERYMSAGRVDFAFRNHTLQFGLTQTVLYGGARGFEWYYLNPFIFYHGEQLNEPQNLRANTMGALDFVFYPRSGVELYGQFLVDDIQIERTGPGDLEPNELGFLFGFQVADPASLRGFTIGAEYTRVTNRTYNTLPEAEKYVHRDKPIGHFLGNDFDRWLIHTRQYLGHGCLLNASVDIRRHGEGRFNGPFDTPWRAFTVKEGYSEPFPTGIVEKSQIYSVEFRWHPKAAFFGAITGRYTNASNFENVLGKTRQRKEIFLRLWWELEKFWNL